MAAVLLYNAKTTICSTLYKLLAAHTPVRASAFHFHLAFTYVITRRGHSPKHVIKTSFASNNTCTVVHTVSVILLHAFALNSAVISSAARHTEWV